MKHEKDMEVMGLKLTCPKCGSTQFSVIPYNMIRPQNWPSGILGMSDCRGCQQDFLVRIAPELEMSFWTLAKFYPFKDIQGFLKFLFRRD